MELIARHHRLAELGAVDAHEVDELGLYSLAEVVHAQRAGRLRQALDDQHARHDRKLGKWPWKNGSLMVTFLTPMQLSSPFMS